MQKRPRVRRKKKKEALGGHDTPQCTPGYPGYPWRVGEEEASPAGQGLAHTCRLWAPRPAGRPPRPSPRTLPPEAHTTRRARSPPALAERSWEPTPLRDLQVPTPPCTPLPTGRASRVRAQGRTTTRLARTGCPWELLDCQPLGARGGVGEPREQATSSPRAEQLPRTQQTTRWAGSDGTCAQVQRQRQDSTLQVPSSGTAFGSQLEGF